MEVIYEKSITIIRNLCLIVQSIVLLVFVYCWITDKQASLYETSMIIVAICSFINLMLVSYSAIKKE